MIDTPLHLLLRLSLLFRYLKIPDILNQLFAANFSYLSNTSW